MSIKRMGRMTLLEQQMMVMANKGRPLALRVTSERCPDVERKASALIKPGVFVGMTDLGALLACPDVSVEIFTPMGRALNPRQLTRLTPEGIDELAARLDKLGVSGDMNRVTIMIDPKEHLSSTALGDLLALRDITVQMQTPDGRSLDPYQLGQRSSEEVDELALRIDRLCKVYRAPGWLRTSPAALQIAQLAANTLGRRLGMTRNFNIDHVGVQIGTAQAAEVLADLPPLEVDLARSILRHDRKVQVVTFPEPFLGKITQAEIMMPKPGAHYDFSAMLEHVAFVGDRDELQALITSGKVHAGYTIELGDIHWVCEKAPFKFKKAGQDEWGFKFATNMADVGRIVIQFRSDKL